MKIKPLILSTLIMASASASAQPPPGGGPGGLGGPMDGPPDGPGSPGGPSGMGPRRPGPGGPGGRIVEENFFPPELVMRNQRAIDLSPDQQTAIKAEMKKTMPRFAELQWSQTAEEETMGDLVKAERPDEKQVLAQLDKLLEIENEMKRLQLALMIKIKNILKPEQQAKLRDLKPQRPGPPGEGGGPPRREGGRPPEQ